MQAQDRSTWKDINKRHLIHSYHSFIVEYLSLYGALVQGFLMMKDNALGLGFLLVEIAPGFTLDTQRQGLALAQI